MSFVVKVFRHDKSKHSNYVNSEILKICYVGLQCTHVLPPALPSEVSEWDTEDVCQWFEELGLVEYQENIQTHEITGKELVVLHRADLVVSEH